MGGTDGAAGGGEDVGDLGHGGHLEGRELEVEGGEGVLGQLDGFDVLLLAVVVVIAAVALVQLGVFQGRLGEEFGFEALAFALSLGAVGRLGGCGGGGVGGLVVEDFVDQVLHIEALCFGDAHLFGYVYEFDVGFCGQFCFAIHYLIVAPVGCRLLFYDDNKSADYQILTGNPAHFFVLI